MVCYRGMYDGVDGLIRIVTHYNVGIGFGVRSQESGARSQEPEELY